ncbi:non-specific lipid transfer protein GPI-anchored 30 [Argentina anserina]|uniref:non-specific lipid transfer protein GPI-anchored 30 n=1 Tax=Argentina anserina TaxID=57926 RepID=UPI0021764CBD|nr:non-specific lipid transfer protein GPI-anchored 30 [Potentilla anserina]
MAIRTARKKQMEMKSWACFGVSLVVLLFVDNISNVVAQDTSCLAELAPCLNYLNGTRNPPDNCCDPLKSVIKSNPRCLCSMITNRGTTKAEQAGINILEAQQLPGRCGQHVNPISCLSSNSPKNSGNSVPNSANTYSLPSLASMVAAALSTMFLQIGLISTK